MAQAHFITPVGEFIAVFDTVDDAVSAAGSDYEFKGINGEIMYIPLGIQNQSVILITKGDREYGVIPAQYTHKV
jgi:hypothetical protein